MIRFRIVGYMHFPIPLIIWNEKLILIYTYTKKKMMQNVKRFQIGKEILTGRKRYHILHTLI